MTAREALQKKIDDAQAAILKAATSGNINKINTARDAYNEAVNKLAEFDSSGANDAEQVKTGNNVPNIFCAGDRCIVVENTYYYNKSGVKLMHTVDNAVRQQYEIEQLIEKIRTTSGMEKINALTAYQQRAELYNIIVNYPVYDMEYTG